MPPLFKLLQRGWEATCAPLPSGDNLQGKICLDSEKNAKKHLKKMATQGNNQFFLTNSKTSGEGIQVILGWLYVQEIMSRSTFHKKSKFILSMEMGQMIFLKFLHTPETPFRVIL